MIDGGFAQRAQHGVLLVKGIQHSGGDGGLVQLLGGGGVNFFHGGKAIRL